MMRLGPVLVLLVLALPAAAGPSAREGERPAVRVLGRVRQAVVRVEVVGRRERGLPSSGVFVGPRGVVLTWLARGAPGWKVNVLMPGRERRAGEVVWRDRRTGMTAVRTAGEPPVWIAARSGRLVPGDPVFSAGYAFGTERADDGPAVGSGVIAQVRRSDRPKGSRRYLLSSAVNPGEYGGALVDRDGRLAGILTGSRDRVSGLPSALPVSALRTVFEGSVEATAALEPAPASGDSKWPIHDRLRTVAARAARSTASLIEAGSTTSGGVSCFLVDDEGHAVTSLAASGELAWVAAVLPDGRELPATIIGEDRRLGIALVKIDGEDLPPPLTLADGIPGIGSFVAAVGNPNGGEQEHGPLVTVGVVGARDREFRRYGALHTDAAVNRGNAGGALVNLKGEAVGILTTLGGASLDRYGANSGVGFAIPSSALLERLDALKAGEKFEYRPGYLGVELDRDPQPGGGLAIVRVEEDKPAKKAGLLAGDVLLQVEGRSVKSLQEVSGIFRDLVDGQEIELTIRRGEDVLTIRATLGRRPE